MMSSLRKHVAQHTSGFSHQACIRKGHLLAYSLTILTRRAHLCRAVQVLSPLPRFINSGFTAWADAGGSPLIFVMRCNPQHYYLVHEFGHRVGMSHATVSQNVTLLATQLRACCCLGLWCGVSKACWMCRVLTGPVVHWK